MTMGRRKKDEGPGGAPEWMTTYGDLVTLLMCFFVLLFAFSEIDAQKFEAVMESFQGSAGILSGGETLSEGPLVFSTVPEVDVTQSSEAQNMENLEMLKEIVEEFLEVKELDEDIIVELDSRGLVIRFPDEALFDSGKADIKPEARETLTFLGELLNTEEFADSAIRVEGHTDNIPINTFRFPTNWELSTTRATNVLKFFVNEGNLEPNRLAASGYGEYYPLASNDTREGRARNRRVDVVILSEHFSDKEPNNN